MNKKRQAELVPRTRGQTDDGVAAREINAEPWEPPPGMVKRQCPRCRYFFAAPSTKLDAVLLCPDCAAVLSNVLASVTR